jgi:hypothetical protein
MKLLVNGIIGLAVIIGLSSVTPPESCSGTGEGVMGFVTCNALKVGIYVSKGLLSGIQSLYGGGGSGSATLPDQPEWEVEGQQ